MLEVDDIRAVVFDIGGVFLIPHPVEVGRACPDEAYRRAHYRGVASITESGIDPDEGDPQVWGHYERGYFAELGVEPPVEHRRHWAWPLAHNISAVARFATAGVALAVVSNNDGTAEQQMIDFGVGQVGPGPLPELVTVVDSTLAGVAKPNPAIFDPALEALGLPAEQVLYVGDTVHADVAGARAANMPVVQLDPYDFHARFDHPRAPDVAAIAAAFGV